MKIILIVIFIFSILVSSINLLIAQDNASYDAHKRALIGTQVTPDYSPRAPVKMRTAFLF